jgi:hypothetical protein
MLVSNIPRKSTSLLIFAVWLINTRRPASRSTNRKARFTPDRSRRICNKFRPPRGSYLLVPTPLLQSPRKMTEAYCWSYTLHLWGCWRDWQKSVGDNIPEAVVRWTPQWVVDRELSGMVVVLVALRCRQSPRVLSRMILSA